MGKRRPSVAEKRLARVRALKDEFFSDDLTLEEQLHAKDAQIARLEREIDILRAKLKNQRSEPEPTAPKSSDNR